MTDDSPIEVAERHEGERDGGQSESRPVRLRRATVQGTAWSYVSFISVRLPALVTIIILTRLISPSDFGVVALGLVVLAYLEILVEVQEPDVGERPEVERDVEVGATGHRRERAGRFVAQHAERFGQRARAKQRAVRDWGRHQALCTDR